MRFGIRKRFDVLHVVIRHAEVMSDLVHEHMRNEMTERLFMLGPVVQDRPTIKINVIGQSSGFGNGAILRKSDAGEEPEQIERAFRIHFLEHIFVRKIRDLNNDAFAKQSELFRQSRKSGFCHPLEFGERRRGERVPVG